MVLAFAAVVVGADGLDPIVLRGDAAPGVGYVDDVEELLGYVGGDDQAGGVCRQGRLTQEGVGPLLGPGRGPEVGVVHLS